MQHRFRPEQHLRRAAEFQRVREEGARFDCRFFMARFAAGENGRRLGIVVSKRMGNAVARNRCKRRCRELFRLHQDLLPPAVDVVVVARRALAKAKHSEVEEEWLRLCARIKHKHSGTQ